MVSLSLSTNGQNANWWVHIQKHSPKKIGFSSLNTATNIFQVFSDISHNFSSKHLGKLLTNSLLSTHKNTHPRPPSQLTPVHTYTNFWANTHKLPLSRSHTHTHTHTSRRRGSLRQWGTWQWEVIEKALERCQCITIISPVDPTEIQAQSAVAETHTHTCMHVHMHTRAHTHTHKHTHTHTFPGRSENLCVRVCVCVYTVDRRLLWASYWWKCIYTDTHTHLNGAHLLPWVSAYQPQSLKSMCTDTWFDVSLNPVPEIYCKGKDVSQR